MLQKQGFDLGLKQNHCCLILKRLFLSNCALCLQNKVHLDHQFLINAQYLYPLCRQKSSEGYALMEKIH